MQPLLTFLLGTALILVVASKQGPARATRRWSQHLNGWQKGLGLVAFVVVLLIMINPELLALGLVGDTAFLDMLVLGLTLQMHVHIVRAWQRCATLVTRGARCVGIPSPWFLSLLALSAVFFSSAATASQKALHRFS